jgi:hypothetical protein
MPPKHFGSSGTSYFYWRFFPPHPHHKGIVLLVELGFLFTVEVNFEPILGFHIESTHGRSLYSLTL